MVRDDSVAITTILRATEPEEKKRKLAAWRERVGEEAAEEALQAGIARGNLIHQACEDYFNYGMYIDQPGSKRLEAFFDRLQWRYTELNLENVGYGYHGKTDWFGLIADPDGSGEMRRCVIDWKGTKKDPKKAILDDGPLQVAAYCKADGIECDLGALVYINPETWDFTPYWFKGQEIERNFKKFLIRKQQYHELKEATS
jgi:genome maintenance exonuclease 1